MATYRMRGNSHNVIYRYHIQPGCAKQQWETYPTRAEAMKRKCFIDALQKDKRYDEVSKAAHEYKYIRQMQRAARKAYRNQAISQLGAPLADKDNSYKTYRDFAEKWLPYHVRKKRLSPNTFDNYRQNLDNHILPYFGNRIMSTITGEDIDDFLDYLSRKRCKGTRSYGKRADEIPTLSSSSIKKCFTILTAGFRTAKRWRYIREIPDAVPPSEKWVKRKAWEASRVRKVLESIEDDPILHLAVHLAFVCSLRAGEVAGIDLNTVSFLDRSLWITRQVQRVSDKSLQELPKQEILRVFPKQVLTSTSSLILKAPKTEGSRRKQYLTRPLLAEIEERLREIQRQKELLGKNYIDYGLLLCQPDGRPLDPKNLGKAFKAHQTRLHIPPEEQIEFHGLRKSGQMHKVRLSMNNYQLVAESSGQSPEVLMNHYNESLDSEKRTLSHMVESDFYSDHKQEEICSEKEALERLFERIRKNPVLSQQLMQNLLLSATYAQ